MITVLLGLWLAATQQDRPVPPSAAEAYKALLTKYAGPARGYINDQSDRGQAAAKEFFAFVKEHPDAPEAVEALGWVASHCLFMPEGGAAMKLLAEDHAQAPNLAPVLAEIDRMYGGPFPPNEEMLRVVLKVTPHRQVRGRAALALAHEINAKKVQSEQHAVLHSRLPKGAVGPFVEKPKETDADLARWADEAAALCERVLKEFDDIPSLNAEAEASLRTIREIAVGRMAPEIEGRDHEGKAFRLSDYRGKVVLLTFVTSTCPPCRALSPRQRELVSRYKDGPFALVSVYADPNVDYIKKAIDGGEISWRSWCDGDADGPIGERWDVRSYPQIFVLDAAGVIRHKADHGEGMEGMIEALVAEVKSHQ